MGSTFPKVLFTICARAGSKGVPSKNIRLLNGKPLLAYSIEQALKWPSEKRVVVSTDGAAIADVARKFGAEVPFMRPAEMATDTAGKLPAIIHALQESERHFGEKYDVIIDLDPTSPLRAKSDFERGWQHFLESGCDLCFSVVKARKNPYFNMVERNEAGKIQLVKKQVNVSLSRQVAPRVWDMNASIYIYKRDFLLSSPGSIWESQSEIFEMPPESAFDIDEERDFLIVESLMKQFYRFD